MRLKGENGIMKKKFITLHKEIDDKSTEIVRFNKEQKKYREIIRGLEKEIVTHKKEIQVRDDYIQEKEKRVFELKKSNQELEKFRFVMEHRIKNLRNQMEPREQVIEELNETSARKSGELENHFDKNTKLEKTINEYRKRLEHARQEVEGASVESKRVANKISAFKRNLEFLMEKFQDEPHLLQVRGCS
jgi:chromosome segregation ATPase